MNKKPLGRKNYGSIPHLPGSRMGPGDHKCAPGQKRIACEEARDKHDLVIVQEKLDGSNVGVAKIDGKILSLTRAGYLAQTSPYYQHQVFATWVRRNEHRFLEVLKDDERLCGEWLMQAHGTKYNLPHEPLVVFDLMVGTERITYNELVLRMFEKFTMPRLLSLGKPCSIEKVLNEIKFSGHGAIDPVEGAVWRVERKGKVDFLVKYVRPEKIDGIYLESNDSEPIYNWLPKPNSCSNCGSKFEEVIDPIQKKYTGYLFRCPKCTPKNIIKSIG